ncbi:hypothetical protein GN244_ATG07261 [Phytophthora infestans]|uniref:Uncharacterized protein n=1 Tax=Phytophthora infestans TaxID=4787 RepID=A0A833TGR0_PHYIN|nr:hypothetical protein GN244_ATG07261 [Phytophthora infestans]KAF4150431.1 hypothetical protein GN958_ATG00376 [Phytophthora infestans]
MSNLDSMAKWSDNGCATYEQVKLMEDVVMANNKFEMVQSTVNWTDTLQFNSDDIAEPFEDMLDVSKTSACS